MQVTFVALHTDAAACLALSLLERDGYQTQRLTDGDDVSAGMVGLFSSMHGFRNSFLRIATHRMRQEGFEIPTWARDLPFLVAIHASVTEHHTLVRFRFALRQMASEYAKWGPWMKRPDAPWGPTWQHGEPHCDFATWHAKACEAVSKPSNLVRLQHRLKPVFQINGEPQIRRLVVTGCALFNKPHTDVIDTIPLEKRESVVDELESVIHDSGIDDVRFIVPQADLLENGLRDHFHLFMFMSIAEVKKHLGSYVGADSRILGHVHARSDDEVARALEVSGQALVREIIEPVRARTGLNLEETSWTGYIGPYLKAAHAIAQKHSAAAEEIYMKRVETRPSYASLHKISPEHGLRRTISNNVFYIAEAMYLRDNPDTAIVNCEFADTFWKGLEEVLAQEVWGDFRPFIGMVSQAVRQPWGY